ncbi:hypothetical protein, partial [Pseudomonas petroselini]|uniref:hypothetical protein n=1 Tax=Pseudomonas petroselini TaxID=2899822 RepID=UPI003CC63232
MPVEVEEVAVFQPQTFALAFDVGGGSPQRSPQRLQVGVAKAEGGGEFFSARVHANLCGERLAPRWG